MIKNNKCWVSKVTNVNPPLSCFSLILNESILHHIKYNKMNDAGPRNDPWGTPQLITFDLHALQWCTMRHGGFRTVWPTCMIQNGSAKRRWTRWWRWDAENMLRCGRSFFFFVYLYHFGCLVLLVSFFLVVTSFLFLNCLRFSFHPKGDDREGDGQ